MPQRADSKKEISQLSLSHLWMIFTSANILLLFPIVESIFVVRAAALIPQTSNHVKPKTSAKFDRHSRRSQGWPLRVNSNISPTSENSSSSPNRNSSRDALYYKKDTAFEDPSNAHRELFSAPTVLPTAAIVCQIGDEEQDADLGCTFDDNIDNDGYSDYLHMLHITSRLLYLPFSPLFNSSFCKFETPNEAGATPTFTRNKGGTSTSLTGPSGDSSTLGSGYYMYSESSGNTGTELQLKLRVNNTFCSQGVSFW